MKTATIRKLPELDYAGRESLNSICSNLSFVGRNIRCIVISGVAAGIGKSFLAMQIAANLGKRGKNVVLVDADMRRSQLVKKYGIDLHTTEQVVGLAHHLAGYNELDDVLHATNLPGVSIIPAGCDISDPVPLLASPYFGHMIDVLTEQFDLVLVDSPPIDLVIDAAEIAEVCDGCILVLNYNETRRKDVVAAEQQIEETGCRILGYIINNVSFNTLSSKKYYNRTYYSHYSNEYYGTPDQKGKRKKQNRIKKSAL